MYVETYETSCTQNHILRRACFCHVCHRSMPFIPTEVEMADKQEY